MKCNEIPITAFMTTIISSVIVFTFLWMVWLTGILMPIQTVRWCMQFDSIIFVTSFVGFICTIILVDG